MHKGNALVHVSGHASAGELLYCYNIVHRATCSVHGEIRHMLANAELARQTGVPADQVVIAEDGVVVDLVDGKAKIAGKVDCGYVFVDGSSVGDITGPRSRTAGSSARRASSRSSWSSTRSPARCPAAGDPRPRLPRERRRLRRDRALVDGALDRAVAEGVDDTYHAADDPPGVGRWVSNKHRRRPMIIPVVLEA